MFPILLKSSLFLYVQGLYGALGAGGSTSERGDVEGDAQADWAPRENLRIG